MPKNKEKVKNIKTGMTTVGILTGLGLTSAAAGFTFYATEAASQVCTSTSSYLGTFIENLMSSTLKMPSFILSLATNLPSKIPIATNISTPYGTFPINTTLDLNLPEQLTVTINPLLINIEEIIKQFLGPSTVDFIHTIPSSVGSACNEYIPESIAIVGGVLTCYVAWQVALSFGLSSKALEHEAQIKELLEVVVQNTETSTPTARL